MQKRRLLQDKNQGVYVEDILNYNARVREGARTSLLPATIPNIYTNVGLRGSTRDHKPQRSIDARKHQ